MGQAGRHRLVSLAAAEEHADVHLVTVRRWVAAARLPVYG